MNQQYGFYIDTSKCTGCKACMIACKDKNDLPEGVKWRRVYEYGGGQWSEAADGTVRQSVFAYYASVGCNHCSEPVCTKACPTGACYKRSSDGIVMIDASVCIGCQSCAQACPYDAPQFNADKGVMTKCDGCIDRLAVGKRPACVDACTMRAADFGTIEELRAKYGDNADIHPLPNSSITNPNLVVNKHPDAQAGGSILNTFEV